MLLQMVLFQLFSTAVYSLLLVSRLFFVSLLKLHHSSLLKWRTESCVVLSCFPGVLPTCRLAFPSEVVLWLFLKCSVHVDYPMCSLSNLSSGLSVSSKNLELPFSPRAIICFCTIYSVAIRYMWLLTTWSVLDPNRDVTVKYTPDFEDQAWRVGKCLLNNWQQVQIIY